VRHTLYILCLLAVAAVMSGGCGDGEPTGLGDVVEQGQAAGYNVLLVTLDTVRQDRLGCYGYALAETPTIDALAAGGVQYHDAAAPAPLTLPSHTTILTGQDPHHHGVRDNGLYALGDEATTLTEDLQAAGYATAAFVGAFVLDARYGLDRGFEVYDYQVSETGYRPQLNRFNERPANEVTNTALAWLEEHAAGSPDRPFFVWVHYFDAHLPYDSPLEERTAFRGRGYDAEIAFVDIQLGRLVRWLDANDERNNTVIIVTADHGESLGEHEEQAHGMFIYNSTMKVPLIVNSPALIRERVDVASGIVGLVDLRDTVGDMLGIRPTSSTDGRSLLDPLAADRYIYMESESPRNTAGCSPLYGLQSHFDKYILAPESEFYDLLDDPGETRNLYADGTGRVAGLAAALRTAMGGAATASERQISDEEVTRLRSLGYVHTTSRRDQDDLPDPKHVVSAFNDGMQAELLYFRRKYPEAAELAGRAMARCPSCVVAVRVLAFSKLRMGWGDEAVAILAEAVERTNDLFLLRSLVQARIINEDLSGALESLEQYRTLEPDNGWCFLLRGDIYEKMGSPEQARAEYRKALEMDEIRVGDRARQRIEKFKGR